MHAESVLTENRAIAFLSDVHDMSCILQSFGTESKHTCCCLCLEPIDIGLASHRRHGLRPMYDVATPFRALHGADHRHPQELNENCYC